MVTWIRVERLVSILAIVDFLDWLYLTLFSFDVPRFAILSLIDGFFLSSYYLWLNGSHTWVCIIITGGSRVLGLAVGDSVGLRWSLGIRISSKLPEPAGAARLGTTRWEPSLQMCANCEADSGSPCAGFRPVSIMYIFMPFRMQVSCFCFLNL